MFDLHPDRPLQRGFQLPDGRVAPFNKVRRVKPEGSCNSSTAVALSKFRTVTHHVFSPGCRWGGGRWQ